MIHDTKEKIGIFVILAGELSAFCFAVYYAVLVAAGHKPIIYVCLPVLGLMVIAGLATLTRKIFI